MILWKPVVDEIDRALFAWSEMDGWTAVAGWSGLDVFAPTYWYTLEEVIRESNLGVERRAILWKWLQWGPEKFQIKPDAADQSEFQETCEHLGYASYTIEPIQGGGWWIIPPLEN